MFALFWNEIGKYWDLWGLEFMAAIGCGVKLDVEFS